MVICPKCGKIGFLSERWVRRSSNYFPLLSVHTRRLEEFFAHRDLTKKIICPPSLVPFLENVRIFKKKGYYNDKLTSDALYKYTCIYDPKGNHLSIKPHYIRVKKGETKEIVNKQIIFQVLGYGIKWRTYVGHYDSKKYAQKMKEFREGKLKFRPNGRTWCLIR